MKDFIFVHVPRTAGTSIESVLQDHRDHFVNKKSDGHALASDIKAQVDEDVWRNSWKFGFVRNPWDRIYSIWKLDISSGKVGAPADTAPALAFKDWWNLPMPPHNIFPPQSLWRRTPQSRWLEGLDYTGFFEQLEQHWKWIQFELGINTPLPHIHKTEGPPYQEVYEQEMIDAVAEVFAEDIKNFKYTF